ncbi:MAG: MmgE/PrpD family protein [Desulfobacteraceae bacterium]|nr:MmgE/PrpD family protein [Desulfobacteraceae bacterium]
MTMWATEVLADFILALRPGDVPAPAREMAKRCILDLVGAAAAGFDTPPARAMRHACTGIFSSGSSGVWFTDSRLGCAPAAAINAAAASALDIDDGQRTAGGHPGASIVPAALAAAEETGADAEELLAAIAVGYEVGIRVAAARDFAALDTCSTGRWCSYGAAAAGAFLRRLPAKKLAEALAIAGVQSPGLSASGYSAVMGNHVKEGIPWSTLTGLVALDLAELGFTGPTDILDHPSYFDRNAILANLGERYAIERVYFKPYSCCRWIHSALDALLGLMVENGIEPGQIERIRVHTFERALRLNNYSNPDSLEGAQYSIPFSLAVAALKGRGTMLPMKPDCLGQADIVALAEKVELSIDPELDRLFPARAPARLVLKTARGEWERLVRDAWGDPDNPMDVPSLEKKFRTLTDGIFRQKDQDEAIDAVAHLETGGLERLIGLLGTTAGRR